MNLYRSIHYALIISFFINPIGYSFGMHGGIKTASDESVLQAAPALAPPHWNQNTSASIRLQDFFFECRVPNLNRMAIFHIALLAVEVLWLFGLIGCIETYCDPGFHKGDDPNFVKICHTTCTDGKCTTRCNSPKTVCIPDHGGQPVDTHHKFHSDTAFRYIGIPEFVFLGTHLLPWIGVGLYNGARYLYESGSNCLSNTYTRISNCFSSCRKGIKNRKLKQNANDIAQEFEEEFEIPGLANSMEDICLKKCK